MGHPFRIVIASDVDYNELIASIECDNQQVAVICQDLGPDRLEVFLYPRRDGLPWRFKFADFQGALSEAKKKLLEG